MRGNSRKNKNLYTRRGGSRGYGAQMRGNSKKSKNHWGTESHGDSDIIFKIKLCLIKKYGIRASQILTECSILLRAEGYELLGTLTPRQLRQIKGLIHTPDLVVIDDSERILFIIEQDGKIHNSPDFATKDGQRNDHYSEAGIPCIVLKTPEIRSSKMTTAEFLGRELEKIGIKKPAGRHIPDH